MARLNPGLITALANPSYADSLSSGIQGAFDQYEQAREARKKQSLFSAATELQEKYQSAVLTDDAATASQTATQMLQLGKAESNPELIKAGLAAQAKVPELKTQGGLKAVTNIDRALQNESLDPRAKAALEQRRAQLLSDNDIGTAYEKARLQQADKARERAMEDINLRLKASELADAQEKQAVQTAVSALQGGMDTEQLYLRFPKPVAREAELAYNEFEAKVQEARDTRTQRGPIDTSGDAFKSLMPEQQRAIINTANEKGNKAARNLLGRYIEDNADVALQKRTTLSEDLKGLSIDTIATQYLSNRDTEWSSDQNVAEFFREQDEEVQTQMREDIRNLWAAGMQVAQMQGFEDPREERRFAKRYVDQNLAQRYGLDLSSTYKKEEKQALREQLVRAYMAKHEGIPEEVARKRVQDEINKRIASRAISRGNIN